MATPLPSHPSNPEPSFAQQLPTSGALAIKRGFDRYTKAFFEITGRARIRFEQGDWSGMQADAKERLALYRRILDSLIGEVKALLGPDLRNPEVWASMRDVYSGVIAGDPTLELAETFFNSVTRRIFTTVGVNPAIEYVDFEFERVTVGIGDRPYRTHVKNGSTASLVRAVLTDYPFGVGYRDLDGDSALAAARIESRWAEGVAPVPVEAIDMLRPVFYRRKGAYLIGRVRGGNRIMPLALALVRTDDGIELDAALVSEEDVSIAFSFTRSYFHAAARSPSEVIQFLRSLMPRKPIAELYAALGHNKHGKTEFYRSLRQHVAHTDDRFVFAPGAKGLVMIVFTMPSYDVVFKIIRDRFCYPKQTTREEVRRRYQLVFEHDRAGRLVDAQEFEHLAFAKHLFAPDLLDELLHSASNTVSVEGNRVVIKHLYTERRVRPLNLYLRDADPAAAERAVVDYGQAIRDLAMTNVFPGDLLLKNFGVTRHGRVIFYDYDELCLLSECQFRRLPEPRTLEDELAAEPWFHVGPNDVFPEEFIKFLEFSGPVRDAFLRSHSCLMSAEFWTGLQNHHADGRVLDVFPYPGGKRLRPPSPSRETNVPAEDP